MSNLAKHWFKSTLGEVLSLKTVALLVLAPWVTLQTIGLFRFSVDMTKGPSKYNAREEQA